jgi:hypothetical protein
MKHIRQSVFETNSSSSHSITINSSATNYTSISPDADGIITINTEGYEFGWGYDRYNDFHSKASYCAVDQQNTEHNLEMLKKVIVEHTGAKEVKLIIDPNSYIDHQSYGTSADAFESEQTLKDFLFSKNSQLFIDNDNH